MFEHRFREQLLEQQAATQLVPGSNNFVCMPNQDQQGLAWFYQKAYEDAKREVQAVRRSKMLVASLN